MGPIEDRAPLSKVEIQAEKTQLQKIWVWLSALYCKINRGHGICPLYGGYPLFGESIIRGRG